MTADDVHALVVRLSVEYFVRYWPHWNHPYEPEVRAIECRDVRNESVRVKELEQVGFQWDEVDHRYYK